MSRMVGLYLGSRGHVIIIQDGPFVGHESDKRLYSLRLCGDRNVRFPPTAHIQADGESEASFDKQNANHD